MRECTTVSSDDLVICIAKVIPSYTLCLCASRLLEEYRHYRSIPYLVVTAEAYAFYASTHVPLSGL